jgi:hypothetical protein
LCSDRLHGTDAKLIRRRCNRDRGSRVVQASATLEL